MHDPEAALNKFCSLFLMAVSSNTRTMKCRKKYKYPHNPWMTDGLLKSLRTKENMYKKTKRQPFNTALARRYRCYCKLLNILLKRTKKAYYESKFVQNKNNPKNQWQLLNSFLNRSSGDAPITKINYNGLGLSEPNEIANAFSDYFSSVILVTTGVRSCIALYAAHHSRSFCYQLHQMKCFPLLTVLKIPDLV